VTELITNVLEGLLGATWDGIHSKRSGGVNGGYRGRNSFQTVWRGYWGLQVTDLITSSLEGLLWATGDGMDSKRSGGITAGYRGRN
jgi:hypothetical protein